MRPDERPSLPSPRARSASRAAARLCAIHLFIAALLIAAGCVSDPGEPGPVSGYGAVEGYVLECGAAVPSLLEFSPRNSAQVDTWLRVTPDSTGWYRAELPVGDYRVYVRMTANQGSSSSVYSEADTVRVGRAVRRRDFPRGRAQVTVRLPDSFDGSTASLTLYRPGTSVDLGTTVSDGLATYDLRLVPQQSFVMRMGLGWFGSSYFLPGTHLIVEADSLHVGAAPVAYETDTRSRHARLEGRVTGSWQSSGETMDVRAYAPGQQRRGLAACEPDGSFRLDLIAPVFVRVSAVCGAVERWYGGAAYATATWLELAPGQVIAGIEMREGGLRLRFEGPGLLVDNVGNVELVHPDGTRRQLNLGRDNPVLVPNLAAGDYRLHVLGACGGDPWLAQWYDGAADEEGASTLTVVEGAFTDATIRQQAGGVLHGSFVGDPDAASAPRHLRIYRGDGAPLCGEATYFWEGAFWWQGLPDGDYLLGTTVYGTTWWFPGTWDQAAAGRITIVDAGTVAGLAWLVPPQQVVIRQ
jgi:hypothetical protein